MIETGLPVVGSEIEPEWFFGMTACVSAMDPDTCRFMGGILSIGGVEELEVGLALTAAASERRVVVNSPGPEQVGRIEGYGHNGELGEGRPDFTPVGGGVDYRTVHFALLDDVLRIEITLGIHVGGNHVRTVGYCSKDGGGVDRYGPRVDLSEIAGGLPSTRGITDDGFRGGGTDGDLNRFVIETALVRENTVSATNPVRGSPLARPGVAG